MKTHLHRLNVHMVTVLCVISINSVTAQNVFTKDANFPSEISVATSNPENLTTNLSVSTETNNSDNMNTAKTSSPVIGFNGITHEVVEGEVEVNWSLEVSEFANCFAYISFDGESSSASNYDDFIFKKMEIYFESTSDNQNFDFSIFDDFIVEGDETVVLEIFEVTGGCTIDPSANILTVTIIDNELTAIDDFEQNGIELFTNYNELSLNLEAQPKNDTKFYLIDISGKPVFNANVTSVQNKFHIGELPTGIYIAQIIIDGKSIEKKVYIN